MDALLIVAPALIPSPGISFVQVGPFQIRFYALAILAGIVLAVLITGRRLRAVGHPAGVVVDVAMWAVPFGILGARIYHVLTHPGDYFFPGADLWRVLYIWEGGIAIYGAIGFGAAALAARKTLMSEVAVDAAEINTLNIRADCCWCIFRRDSFAHDFS